MPLSHSFSPAPLGRATSPGLPPRVSTIALLVLALAAACGGGGTDTITPPAPTPTFTLAVSSIASIAQGDSATVTATVTRSGGFNGTVTLTLTGAPSGVDSQLGTIAAASATADIKLNIGLGTTPGGYPLAVRAEASGLSAQTAPLLLTVVKRRAQFSFQRKSPNDQLFVNRGGLPLVFDVTLGQLFTLVEATLSVASALPPGITATFAPAALTSGVSQVTITADSTAVEGNVVVLLRATAADADTALLSVPFEVRGIARMEVAILQSTLTVARNSSGDASMDVLRFSYDQPFTISTSAMPSDFTVGFERIVNDIPKVSYVARFTAGENAPLGVFPVIVTASAAGVRSGVDTINVTIAPAATGGATAFQFCGGPNDIPIWFGIGRFGSQWVRVLPDATNTFAFDVGIKNDVAWVTQRDTDDFAITVVSGTEAELSAFATTQCTSPSGRTVTGSVANLAASDSVVVAFGPRSTAFPPLTAAAPTFSFDFLPDGAQDLIALRRRVPAGGSAAVFDRLLVRRSLNPAGGAALPVLDFADSDAFAPDAATVRATGLQTGEALTLAAAIETVGGAKLTVGLRAVTGPDSLAFPAVPLSAQLPGDLHRLTATGLITNSGSPVLRSVWRYARTPVNVALALGPVPQEPSVSFSNSTPERARYQAFIPEQPEYERIFSTQFTQQTGAMRRTMTLTATEAVARTSGTPRRRRLEAPSFTGAPGFDVFWELRPGTAMKWTVLAVGWDAIGGTTAPRGDGIETRQYTLTGTVSFP